MNTENTSLCRICLVEGATCPIFGTKHKSKKDSVYFKLSLCLKEEVEDIDGYPTKICNTCIEMLDNICEFIDKYKKSAKLLESGLLHVKKESVDYNNSYSDDDDVVCLSEVEIEIDQVKAEPQDFDDIDNHCLADLLNLNLEPSITKITQNKELTIKKIKSESKVKTNKIATSILEGQFAWTGDKCLTPNKSLLPQKKHKQKSIQQKRLKQEKRIREEKRLREEKRKREEKLNIPKIKQPNPPKLCDLCGEVFRNSDKLNIHKKKVHLQAKVQCPKCPKICASAYYLNRHIKRKHECSKNFICPICGKGFAYKGELSRHNLVVHEKHLLPKKTFACKFCNKTYKCSKSIVVHERAAHTGHRPAECDICGSRFYHVDYLKEHMRLHTGETPFKCPICNRGYAQRGNMKSHLRIHRLSEIDSEIMKKMRPNYLKLLKDFR